MKSTVLLLLTAALALGACSARKKVLPEFQAVPAATLSPAVPVPGGGVRALPRAVIYKMSGDYAANVPVQLNAQGGVVSFPAPSDVRGREPIRLADGWWLDRRGVSEQSAFTRYTYAEYAALPGVPTLAELRASVIPGARITSLRRLDMTPSEAATDTAAVNALIRAN